MTGLIMTISLILLGLSAGLLIVAFTDWWNQKGDK